jgi:dipeptidyl aminopeptidase/acylaminoacyl peptidase
VKRALIGLGLVALLASTAAAQAAYPGSNGRIAFYRADGHIYSIRADGTGLRNLGLGRNPAYSPTGTRIAFNLNGDIWTMAANGTDRQRVTWTAALSESDPTWSPDGSRLAFTREGGTTVTGIYVIKSAPPHGRPVRVEATPTGQYFSAYDFSPSWGTNGLIYFSRFTDYDDTTCEDPTETLTVNSATRQVNEWKFLAIEADPAPRAHAVVYHYAYNDGSCDFADGIYIANADGSNRRAVRPLKTTRPITSRPVFSPDATRVAYQVGRYVYVVNATGTGVRRLTVGTAPTWQPVP